MGRFVVGAERDQTTLFPLVLRTGSPGTILSASSMLLWRPEPRRAGFAGVDAARTGRPGYHPAALLKLYVYGYLNRVPSSRRLEREAGRNVEVMWLIGQLSPDHKTIAEFRRQNGPVIGRVCARFVALCRTMGLLTGTCVAIDGSKFNAVNNRDRNFTQGKLDRRRQQIEESVSRYLSQLDTADRQDPMPELAAKVERLKEKVARLGQEMERLAGLEEQMKAAPDRQVSLTDPDARSMAASGRGSGVVGYNVQVAVETEHHLIVAHAVTNAGSDRAQLSGMAARAKEALEADTLDAVADRGYYSSEQILACERAGIHRDAAPTDDLGREGCRTLRQG